MLVVGGFGRCGGDGVGFVGLEGSCGSGSHGSGLRDERSDTMEKRVRFRDDITAMIRRGGCTELRALTAFVPNANILTLGTGLVSQPLSGPLTAATAFDAAASGVCGVWVLWVCCCASVLRSCGFFLASISLLSSSSDLVFSLSSLSFLSLSSLFLILSAIIFSFSSISFNFLASSCDEREGESEASGRGREGLHSWVS